MGGGLLEHEVSKALPGMNFCEDLRYLATPDPARPALPGWGSRFR